jgi:hypothetical protein
LGGAYGKRILKRKIKREHERKKDKIKQRVENMQFRIWTKEKMEEEPTVSVSRGPDCTVS